LAAEARTLTPEQVFQLEDRTESNPHDLKARLKLIEHYRRNLPELTHPFEDSLPSENPLTRYTGKDAFKDGWPHLLWLIRNYPDLPLTGQYQYLARFSKMSASLRNNYSGGEGAGGPAEQLWNNYLEAYPGNRAILFNAAFCFEVVNLDRAIELYTQLKELEPDKNWAERILIAQIKSKYAKSYLSEAGDQQVLQESIFLCEELLQHYQDIKRYHLVRHLSLLYMKADDFEKAQTYATELLNTAYEIPQTEVHYVNGLYIAHMVLCRIALEDDKPETAERHLLSAQRVLGPKCTSSMCSHPYFILKRFLNRNRRPLVLSFLEQYKTTPAKLLLFRMTKSFSVSLVLGQDPAIDEWVSIIEAGEDPEDYVADFGIGGIVSSEVIDKEEYIVITPRYGL